ncbi:hypothetical protein ACWD0G_27690, partial [Streptomyces goshikiensis]
MSPVNAPVAVARTGQELLEQLELDEPQLEPPLEQLLDEDPQPDPEDPQPEPDDPQPDPDDPQPDPELPPQPPDPPPDPPSTLAHHTTGSTSVEDDPHEEGESWEPAERERCCPAWAAASRVPRAA